MVETVVPGVIVTDVLAAEPSSKVKPLSSGATALVAILGLAYAAAVMAYFVYAALLRYHFCPSSHLAIGPMALGDWPMAGLVLLAVAPMPLVHAWGLRMNATGLPPLDHRRRRAVAGIQASFLFVASAVIWINYTFSYYCVTPRDIQLHPNPLGPSLVLGWDDVTTVRAECLTRRGHTHYAKLVLALSNGFEMELPMGPPGNDTAIRTALSGKHYVYTVAESVRPDICPPEFYPLLTNWRGRAA